MRPPVFVHPFSDEKLIALETRYRQTSDAEERTRCQILLLAHKGMKAQEIAPIVLKSADTVRRTLRRDEAKGWGGLRDRRPDHPGPTSKGTPAWEAELLQAVEQDPHSLGVNRASWTASLLADVDWARIHTPEGAQAVRELLERHNGNRRRVYLPKDSPHLQPQEWLWRAWRAKVTHNHPRTTLGDLEADSEACFAAGDANPAAVLRTIGSPFASCQPL